MMSQNLGKVIGKMDSKIALVSGIRGQDGSFIAELLLKRDYQVIGLTRDPGLLFSQNINHLRGKITLEYTSYDYHSIIKLISKYNPSHIFNLCGQPYVLKSWQMLDETIYGSGVIPCHFLKAISETDKKIRFFQASSSEIFKPDNGEGLTEDSFILPRTPYGCAKAMAHNMVVSFRENYDIFAVNGILFNHESSRRRDNFLSQKVVKEAVRIKKGYSNFLELGNLHVQRDWGYAPEYMDAAIKMLELDSPEDFIIATGITHSVEDMVKIVFGHLGLDYKKFLRINEEYIRLYEPPICRGIPEKANRLLRWNATTSFEDMLKLMIDYEVKNFS